MDALFDISGEHFVPTDLARGPWDANALHGGPTAALVMRAAEHHLAGANWHVARMTLELLRPVPLEPLAVTARTVREGRKVTLVEVRVEAGDADRREVARGVILGIRGLEVDAGKPQPTAAEQPEDLPTPELGPGPGEWTAFHNTAVEMRWANGVWRQPGPATVWMRLRVPVVTGEETSPAMTAVAVADFGNGISSELDFATWRFLNPELTVHLARPPAGEWIRIDARTVLGSLGAALASSELSDRRGPFGRGTQALLIEPA